ncbi:class I SAM-dependent methyltransferase [Amycolatopsis lurida]
MRSRSKDYAAEADEVLRIARRLKPDARSVLDVACGTGLHLQYFTKLFDRAVGLDRSEDMLRFAQDRIPGLPVRCAEMSRFELDESFDVITCMFAIPHLRSPAELDAMVDCLMRHLTAGGVVIIESWFAPEEFLPGYVATDLITDGDRKIFRVSHSVRRGDQAEMVVHYVEADPASGIQHYTEHDRMTLFTREHYKTAFARARCDTEYLENTPFERGLWVAQRVDVSEARR